MTERTPEEIAAGRCKTCRFWTQTKSGFEYDAIRMVEQGDCSRIFAGPARRRAGASIFPVNSGAWLGTYADFVCGEYQSLIEKDSRRG